MNKIIVFLFVLFYFIQAASQQLQTKIEEYKFPLQSPNEKIIIIEMPYGRYDVQNVRGDTNGLRNAGEIMVEVVCTDYPSNLSLEELNYKRVGKIFSLFPYLTKEQLTNIIFLRQLDGGDKEKAMTMFHGVVLRYRPKQTKEAMKEDLAKLEELIIPKFTDTTRRLPSLAPESQDLDSMTSTGKDKIFDDSLSLKISMEFYGCTSDIVKNFKRRGKDFKDADSMAIMTPNQALKKGIIGLIIYKDYADADLMTIFFKRDTFYFGNVLHPTYSFDTSLNMLVFKVPDSTIFKVFNRNKWKKTAVIGDVTGSMYPYTAELLIWLKLQSLDSLTKEFAFFNDGDDMPDDKKVIGHTGGIYFHDCKTFEEVKQLVQNTMLKGGGDCPENDIEALLLTEKEFPENDFQVLIADNWAPIKDKRLIGKLKKPVRVILCGATDYNINVDYLNLARMTNGSLHLIEKTFIILPNYMKVNS